MNLIKGLEVKIKRVVLIKEVFLKVSGLNKEGNIIIIEVNKEDLTTNSLKDMEQGLEKKIGFLVEKF